MRIVRLLLGAGACEGNAQALDGAEERVHLATATFHLNSGAKAPPHYSRRSSYHGAGHLINGAI